MSGTSMQRLYRRKLTTPGVKEGIRQSLYDFQAYDSAATTSLRFFQVPVGGGSPSKTEQDTNMTLAGQIPQGWKFIAESIEVHVFPGSNAASYVRQDPVKTGTSLAAPNFANDVWSLTSIGWLTVKVGSKPYLIEAPLLRFPPKTGLQVNAAAAVENTNTTVLNQITMDYARAVGRPYQLNPVLPLPANTNFEVVLNWAAAVTLPSGFDARIGVVLDGLLFRD